MLKKFKNVIKRIIYPHNYSSEALCNYLRNLGGEVGENTFFFSANTTIIDTNRIDYIKIGKNCKIAGGVGL